MSKKTFSLGHFFLFLVLSLALIIIVISFYFSSNVLGYDVYRVDYHVGDVIGFNLDEDAIHFGTVPPGFRANRDIFIEHTSDTEVHIYFDDVENLYVEETIFFLPANTSKKLTLTLLVPSPFEEGYYNGNLRLIYRKPS